MENALQKLILKEIEKQDLKVFYSSLFLYLGNYKAVSKALEGMANDGTIRRIARGLYDKTLYNHKFKMFAAPNIDDVAKAIANQFNWNICPSNNYILNLLGLSEQVPTKYVYISDGPYRKYKINNTDIEFKHSNKKEVSNFSYITSIIIQAFKAIGKDNIDLDDLAKIERRLSVQDKKTLIKESAKTDIWICEKIKQMCGGVNV